MTSEYKEKLQAYGVNLDSALNRFMKEYSPNSLWMKTSS